MIMKITSFPKKFALRNNEVVTPIKTKISESEFVIRHLLPNKHTYQPTTS